MKKALFLPLLILILLSACKPTPETPPIVGKDQSHMLKAAQAATTQKVKR